MTDGASSWEDERRHDELCDRYLACTSRGEPVPPEVIKALNALADKRAWAKPKTKGHAMPTENNETVDYLELPDPDWESEKAYGYDFTAILEEVNDSRRARAFMPKCFVRDGAAPRWKIKQAVDAALAKAGEGVPGRLLAEGGISQIVD